MPKQTPSQTIGPFFSFGLVAGGENDLVDERCTGERIYLEGRVLDGQGQPVLDALIEIWQADAQGVYNHPSDPRQGEADGYFKGFGRSETTKDGCYWFKTIKPGVVEGTDGQPQAPHINVCIFARGMLMHAYTRIYFEDEERANEQDGVLNSITDRDWRQTLIARRESSADGVARYCLDIVLQSDGSRAETVFFDP